MRPPKSTTPISQAATDLIVSYEVTSESYYSAHYQQPAWPGGASGVTIGIGYDLGYQVAADFEEDWASYLDAVTLAGLATVLGTTGQAASAALASVGHFQVNWAEAIAEFTEQSQPRTIAETEAALENTGELSPDSLGALVSLVYNRGTSFDAPGPRYLEMRKIKALMAAKQFEQIPDQIRAMKRLWPTVPGLQRRRDAEADLFQSGLGA
jgi:GH24 family phage-related lysozyme (muramidase)